MKNTTTAAVWVLGGSLIVEVLATRLDSACERLGGRLDKIRVKLDQVYAAWPCAGRDCPADRQRPSPPLN